MHIIAAVKYKANTMLHNHKLLKSIGKEHKTSTNANPK